MFAGNEHIKEIITNITKNKTKFEMQRCHKQENQRQTNGLIFYGKFVTIEVISRLRFEYFQLSRMEQMETTPKPTSSSRCY